MTVAQATKTYSVSDGSVARDRDMLETIWRGNLGTPAAMTAKFDWFYLDCPYGEPLIQVLNHGHGASPVGACSVGRRRMMFDGAEIRAGVLVDLAVLPLHRSLGPASMMLSDMVASGCRHLDLVLGFPNRRAAVLFSRARYSSFSGIVRHVRVLRHGHYLGRHMPRWLAAPARALADLPARIHDRLPIAAGSGFRVEWTDRADSRMDELWSRSDKGRALVGVRDAEFLRWRFDQSPLVRTRYLLLSDPADGRLRAWFATQVKGDLFQIADFWAEDAIEGLSPACIGTLLREARRQGHAAVSVEMATTPRRLAGWRKTGFRARNSRPVFGYWSKPPHRVDTGVDVHLTFADEDQ